MRVPKQGLLWGAAAVLGAVGILLLKALQGAQLVDARGLAIGGGLLLLAIVAMGRPWWRALDEAAREAHKSAFYWGASVAAALIGYVVLNAALPGHVSAARIAMLWFDPGSQAAGVAAGASLALVLLVAGYGVTWGVWWLRRR